MQEVRPVQARETLDRAAKNGDDEGLSPVELQVRIDEVEQSPPLLPLGSSWHGLLTAGDIEPVAHGIDLARRENEPGLAHPAARGCPEELADVLAIHVSELHRPVARDLVPGQLGEPLGVLFQNDLAPLELLNLGLLGFFGIAFCGVSR